MPAWSEDVEIIPQGGAGFAVKNAANDSIRFKVNESGEVIIPTLPENMAGKPLCWDKPTGILQHCPDAAGTDFTPPTIQVDAPEVATQQYMEVTTRVTDNFELSHLFRAETEPTNSLLERIILPYASGTRVAETTEVFMVSINNAPLKFTYIISDTSGNTAKAVWETNIPKTEILQGTYKVDGLVTPPDGFFDCQFPYEEATDSFEVSINLFVDSPNCPWSMSEGYCQNVFLNIPSLWGLKNEKVQLDSRKISAWSDVYGDESFSYRLTGTFELISSEPQTLQATIIRQCNIDDAGWISGTPLTFTAKHSSD